MGDEEEELPGEFRTDSMQVVRFTNSITMWLAIIFIHSVHDW